MSRLIKTTKYIEVNLFGYASEIKLEIEGNVHDGRKRWYREPEEPMSVDDLTVWAISFFPDKGKYINQDFEPFLTKEQIEGCEIALMEKYNDGE